MLSAEPLLQHQRTREQLKQLALQSCRSLATSAMVTEDGPALFLLHGLVIPLDSAGEESVGIVVRIVSDRVEADPELHEDCQAAAEAMLATPPDSAELAGRADPQGRAAFPPLYLGTGVLLHRLRQQLGTISPEGGELRTVRDSTALMHYADCSVDTVTVDAEGAVLHLVRSDDREEGAPEPGPEHLPVAEVTERRDGVVTLQFPAVISGGLLHRMVGAMTGDTDPPAAP